MQQNPIKSSGNARFTKIFHVRWNAHGAVLKLGEIYMKKTQLCSGMTIYF